MKAVMIGILAGMGPRSTAPFIDLVVDEAQKQYGAKFDLDFPHMLIYSLPTPFYLDREIDDQEMVSSLIHGLKHLEKAGVDFISMPCNTAHAYFDHISKNIQTPLVNMIGETLKKIGNPKKITVLGTPSTMKSNVYQQGIDAKGIEYYFDTLWQESINTTIGLVKEGSIDEAQNLWNQLAEEMISDAVDAAIIACTDLNVLNLGNNSIKLVDSSKTLAEVTIQKYLEMRNT